MAKKKLSVPKADLAVYELDIPPTEPNKRRVGGEIAGSLEEKTGRKVLTGTPDEVLAQYRALQASEALAKLEAPEVQPQDKSFVGRERGEPEDGRYGGRGNRPGANVRGGR